MFGTLSREQLLAQFKHQAIVSQWILEMLIESGVLDDLGDERLKQLHAKATRTVDEEWTRQQDEAIASLSPGEKLMYEIFKRQEG